MKKTLGQTVLVLALIVSVLVPVAPALAAGPANPPVSLDGDATFRPFAVAAKSIPTVTRKTGMTPQGDVLGQTIAFWAYDFKNNAYYQTNATLLRQGSHLALYAETGLTLSDAVLNDIVTQFDTKIYPTETSVFGNEPNPGIDGDARVTLLVLNIKDPYYYGSGGAYIAGYFTAVNEYLQSDLDTWFPGQHKSNQREMVYLDANPAQPGTTSFYFTAAHEFQHLIHWNLDADEETWINEGLADLAGNLSGYGHPASHLNAFLSNADDQLTTWNSTLADYGAAYLFSLYLWEKYGGNDTIHRLVAEQQNGAAGLDAVLAAKGSSDRFVDVFARWTVANYLDDSSLANGFYGYTSLNLVDSGADNVTSFNRPVLNSSTSSSVRSWAARYQKLSTGSGDLNLTFNGDHAGSFNVTMVKSSTATFSAGSNTVQTMTLNATQDGLVTVAGFGSAYPAVLLVAANRSATVNPAAYTYNAAVTAAPTPTPSPTPLPTPSPTPLPGPATVTGTIALQAGWNLISLPVSPTVGLTAESLLRAINAQGGQATEVNRWYAGGWNSHLMGLPFNDFAIELGRGYFVKVSKASTLALTGAALTTAQAVTLAVGWNLVAFPYLPTTHTAETMTQAVNAQGGAMTEFDRWYAGGWNAHLSGLPFNDFTIAPGQAYFAKVSQPSTWRP